ncbi:MAG: HAD family hydrolase [Caldilineaceae bacterium]|nr:HAD family hydrolase [Caldilineaceae bacterium]
MTGHSREDVLRLAGSAEMHSEHHIGAAIIQAAREAGIELEQPAGFHAIAGHGIEATFQRAEYVETVLIGNDRLFASEDMDFSPVIRLIGEALQKQGKTVMLVVRRSTVEDTWGRPRLGVGWLHRRGRHLAPRGSRCHRPPPL